MSVPSGAPQKRVGSKYRNVDGKKWVDESLESWPANDYRMFVGNLSKEVTEEMLCSFFSAYPSVQKVKVIKNIHTGQTKEYGFVSFANPTEFLSALRELNGKYIGTRPCMLKKGEWEKRSDKKRVEKREKNRDSKAPRPPKFN
ncbi:rrm-containing protein, putative [Entamoeba invadens IP1]|uniref:rrm-containing protein, putative n=1 Tax=Entamoeba invadens IP1 TaxID=370355 RepID=UPI0002C3EEF5|nr:rrm-containing protein, putative [Entamoeba invadens IP1]ELP93807.1 rrm-containing protein, putative [Entamoeba invadens IP1]|eukprot:XP_004260578.1 rrm-containing protein, putative [Entamoeba invadens IP1]